MQQFEGRKSQMYSQRLATIIALELLSDLFAKFIMSRPRLGEQGNENSQVTLLRLDYFCYLSIPVVSISSQDSAKVIKAAYPPMEQRAAWTNDTARRCNFWRE